MVHGLHHQGHDRIDQVACLFLVQSWISAVEPAMSANSAVMVLRSAAHTDRPVRCAKLDAVSVQL